MLFLSRTSYILVLNSHLCLVATILDSTDMQHCHHQQMVLLD